MRGSRAISLFLGDAACVWILKWAGLIFDCFIRSTATRAKFVGFSRLQRSLLDIDCRKWRRHWVILHVVLATFNLFCWQQEGVHNMTVRSHFDCLEMLTRRTFTCHECYLLLLSEHKMLRFIVSNAARTTLRIVVIISQAFNWVKVASCIATSTVDKKRLGERRNHF